MAIAVVQIEQTLQCQLSLYDKDSPDKYNELYNAQLVYSSLRSDISLFLQGFLNMAFLEKYNFL